MTWDKDTFLLHQYNALRAEIVQRTSIRFVILTLLMTVFGAVFVLSDKPNGVYLQLLYPVLSLFLLIAYIANIYGIQRLSQFIKEQIETKVSDGDQSLAIAAIGWHHQQPFGISYILTNLSFPISSLIVWVVSALTISDPKFQMLNRWGINITYVVLWVSLAIIVGSFVLALSQRAIFERYQVNQVN